MSVLSIRGSKRLGGRIRTSEAQHPMSRGEAIAVPEGP
jgi:hypothetical protein